MTRQTRSPARADYAGIKGTAMDYVLPGVVLVVIGFFTVKFFMKQSKDKKSQ